MIFCKTGGSVLDDLACSACESHGEVIFNAVLDRTGYREEARRAMFKN